jgi:chemotaxis family two-component system response regulator PixG
MRRNPLLKVLLVDDDPVAVTVVRRWLETAGYEVIARDTPFGTAGMILKHRPDVLLLDVEMPGLDGEVLADAAVRGSHRVEIVFYSGKDTEVLARLVKKHGALGAIHKSSEGNSFVLSFNTLVGPLLRRLRD